MSSPSRIASSFVVVLFAAALTAPARAADPAYPNTTDGLKKLIDDAVAAVKAGDDAKAKSILAPLVLPNADAWFAKTFGDDKGKALAAEYAKMSAQIPDVLPKLLAARIADGRTNAAATKIESAEDPGATGAQKKALAAMKEKVPLYTVRLTKEPGQPAGFTLWSFVFVDGQFRFVNKMGALN